MIKTLPWRMCMAWMVLGICAAEVSADIAYTWVGTQAGDSWHNPSNWNPAGQPQKAALDLAKINSLLGASVYSGIASAHSLQLGDAAGSHGTLHVWGGTVDATGLDIANVDGALGTANVYGGEDHYIRYLCPGFRGRGTLNMYSGYIRVWTQVRIGYHATANGFLNLDGGMISAASLSMARVAGTPASMQVKNGVLLLDGDQVSVVQGYINAGNIYAVPGYTLVLEYDGALYPGVTALYALEGGSTEPGEVRDLYSDTWVATDAAGRSLPGYDQVGPQRANREVGIFYWTWHTSQSGHPDQTVYDVTEIIAANPDAPEFTSSFAAPHHWGRPEMGYYISTDQYVLKKHALMLAQAGVDVVIFDTTNGSFTFKESYMTLLNAFKQLAQAGNQVPQIAFLCPFWEPTPVVEQVYADLYQPGFYEEFWYRWQGKPLIMADPALLQNPAPGLLDFFTFRKPMPSYFTGPTGPKQWGWLNVYPQPVFYGDNAQENEQITVGVGQNASAGKLSCFSNRNGAQGRSWHGGQKDPAPDAVLYGYNIQEQFERALAIDPSFIFITGWNEWVAGRYEKSVFDPDNEVSYYPEAHFPDQYTQEYSRDIEPMQGGHTDTYYYQMVANIRRYKGVRPPPPASAPKTITIDGQFEDWEEVGPEYRDAIGDTVHRSHKGYGTTYYTNTTGRNDLKTMKVARDTANVYFYAETAANLTPHTDPHWMLLLIDGNQNSGTGWEGYDYVVNLNVAEGLTSLHRLTSGWNPVLMAQIPYAAYGNRMELAIPRSVLEGVGDPVKFDFKWADNIQHAGDMNQLFVSGDAAPDRRFNYRYDASLSQRACQTVLGEGHGLAVDLSQDCHIGMSDLVLLAEQWLHDYDLINLARLSQFWMFSYLPDELSPADTILRDNFESGVGIWNTDCTASTTYAYSPVGSARCERSWTGGSRYLYSQAVDLTGFSAARISFRYRLNTAAGNTLNVKYYNGTGDVSRTQLANSESSWQGVWTSYSDVMKNEGSDAQFFNNAFMLKLDMTLSSYRNIHIDDVEIIGIP